MLTDAIALSCSDVQPNNQDCFAAVENYLLNKYNRNKSTEANDNTLNLKTRKKKKKRKVIKKKFSEKKKVTTHIAFPMSP